MRASQIQEEKNGKVNLVPQLPWDAYNRRCSSALINLANVCKERRCLSEYPSVWYLTKTQLPAARRAPSAESLSEQLTANSKRDKAEILPL